MQEQQEHFVRAGDILVVLCEGVDKRVLWGVAEEDKWAVDDDIIRVVGQWEWQFELLE